MNTKKYSRRKAHYRIDLDPALAQDADAVFGTLGQTRTQGITRLLRWFICQPFAIQRDILTLPPDAVGRNTSAADDAADDDARAAQSDQRARRGRM